MSPVNAIEPPPAAAAASARCTTSGIRSKPGGCASTTSMPNLGSRVSRPWGTESGFAYDGAYAHDTATGLAYRTVLPAGMQHVTSQLNVTFLAPAREGRIVARGTVVKRGKRSGYAEADVLGPDGSLLARATALFALLPEPTDA